MGSVQISLTEEIRIIAAVGGLKDATFTFPPFAELQEDIRYLLENKVEVKGTKVHNRTVDLRIRFFDRKVQDAENIPIREGEELVELATRPGWKPQIPAPTKMAVTRPFDELADVFVLEPEALNDPAVVEVDTLFGEVRFFFPSLQDEGFRARLKAMMENRTRQRGRHVKDASHRERLKLFRETCTGVEGIDELDSGRENWQREVPENWAASSCAAFEEIEILAEDDLGN